MKILILGGYGVFGGRLAELLSDIQGAEILIAGRNLGKAQDFCRRYSGAASAQPLRLDRNHISDHLANIVPDIVVDASGPFQNYGDARYSVVEACIAAKVPYLDLADGSDFVAGITRFDQAARRAGIFVLSGVSSFPVLTAAVVRELSRDLEPVSVAGGIAPSPYAGIGLNVMRAVVGYAGGPVRLKRDGEWVNAAGLAESMRYTVSPPGMLPLRNIHFSLVDVPDLQLIPHQYETMRDIWMGAGPVPEVLHRMLNLLAKMRAAFNLPSLTPLAPFFHRVLNLMKFGEHRGGMFVELKGRRDGTDVIHSWHLLAEGDDGPFIPSMAVEAIIRKTLAGKCPQHGARPAMEVLELSDYDALFEKRTIYTGFRTQSDHSQSLYQRVLRQAFENLPKRLRQLHGETGQHRWSGTAEVRRGSSPVAKLVAALFGFPKATPNIPVSVTFTPEAGGERWLRTFGRRKFSSLQTEGQDRDAHLILERFGPITVALAVVVSDNRLSLIPRHWRFLGIPLPRSLLPGSESFETQIGDEFCFDVEISSPLTGLIVAYRGRLRPD